VDQRVLDARGFEEVSVGDAVLAGGEAAFMVVIEACVRLVPGVLGAAQSLSEESFEDGLLEHPQYTRPRSFEGLDIPTCCSAVIMPRWASGGSRRGNKPRGSGGRTCGRSISPINRQRAIKPGRQGMKVMNLIQTLEKEEADRFGLPPGRRRNFSRATPSASM